MDSFGDRLKEFANTKYGSLKELAEAMDILPQALNRYVNDKVEPKANIVVKLMELGADIRWLLTGRKSDDVAREHKELLLEMQGEHLTAIEIGKRHRVPIISVIGAGNEIPFDDVNDDYIDFDDIAVNTVGLRIKGESMMPFINDGDVVLISLTKRAKENDIVAVRTKKGEQFVKKMMLINKEEKKVLLISLNTNYRPMLLGFGEIAVIKKVVRIIKNTDY